MRVGPDADDGEGHRIHPRDGLPAGRHSDAHAGSVPSPACAPCFCGYFQRIVIVLDFAPKVVWLFVESCTLIL